MHMQLRQVTYFVALVEERSFSRAARRCGVTQPSLSNAIANLERYFGGMLFDRKAGLKLTQLGSAIFPCLLEIEQLARGVVALSRRPSEPHRDIASRFEPAA
jgi:DNA-binding transcriptional LysR family regulator